MEAPAAEPPAADAIFPDLQERPRRHLPAVRKDLPRRGAVCLV